MKLKTFRLEFDANGRLVHLMEVDVGQPDGLTVVYVRATTADAARAKAEKLQQRIRLRARRAEYKSRGLCPNDGRKPAPGFRQCELCHAKSRIRHRGGNPSAPKGPQQLEARYKILTANRAEVLLEVKRAWERADTPAAFLRWLRDQLAEVLPGSERAA